MHLQMLFAQKSEGFKMKITYLMAALLLGAIAVGNSSAQTTGCSTTSETDYGAAVAGVKGAKSLATVAGEAVQCAGNLQAANASDASEVASLKASNATLTTQLSAAQSALATKTATDAATISGLNSQLTAANNTAASQASEIAALEAELSADNQQLSSDASTISSLQSQLPATTSTNPCSAWGSTILMVPGGNSLAIPAGQYTCASLTQACYQMEPTSDWNVCAADAFQEWGNACLALAGGNASGVVSLAQQCQGF